MAKMIHTAWSCIDTVWSGRWVPILRRKILLPCEISCICVGVAEAFILLGCCLAWVGTNYHTPTHTHTHTHTHTAAIFKTAGRGKLKLYSVCNADTLLHIWHHTQHYQHCNSALT